MHDGIELDRAGLPTAAIITDEFLVTGQAIANAAGLPDYPYIVMSHPLSSLTEGELRERARELAPAVVRVLTAGRSNRP
ncbi:MAG: hypothetical protein M1370_02450 [Bacteroidetes bacterium]|nr:hypothetical protein [Bacteroidota bacterium]